MQIAVRLKREIRSKRIGDPDGEQAFLYLDAQNDLYSGIADLLPGKSVTVSRLVGNKHGCTYFVRVYGMTVAQLVEIIINIGQGDLIEVERLVNEISPAYGLVKKG